MIGSAAARDASGAAEKVGPGVKGRGRAVKNGAGRKRKNKSRAGCEKTAPAGNAGVTEPVQRGACCTAVRGKA